MNQSKVGRVAVIAVSTCVGIGLGLLVGNILKQDLRAVAVAIGFLTGTPIGLAIALRNGKWLAIAFILDMWALSYVNGRWIGLGLAVVITVLTLYVAAAVTRDVFGAVSGWDAMWKQVQLIVGWVHGLQEIDSGKTVAPNKSGRLLGPQHIKVRPGNAIVLAKSHKPGSGCRLEVIGPGDFTSGVGDYVAAVFDLRERQKLLSFESVQTADAVQLSVQVEARYALNVSQGACQGDKELKVPEQRTLRQMAVSSFDWDIATKDAVENSLRGVVGRVQADQLLKGQRLAYFSHHIHHRAHRQLIGQGISLRSVTIIGAHKA